jgi:hypothetical protein
MNPLKQREQILVDFLCFMLFGLVLFLFGGVPLVRMIGATIIASTIIIHGYVQMRLCQQIEKDGYDSVTGEKKS